MAPATVVTPVVPNEGAGVLRDRLRQRAEHHIEQTPDHLR
jgi:hypothetical protein